MHFLALSVYTSLCALKKTTRESTKSYNI